MPSQMLSEVYRFHAAIDNVWGAEVTEAVYAAMERRGRKEDVIAVDHQHEIPAAKIPLSAGARQRTEYMARLREQFAASKKSGDPIAEYLALLVEQIAGEAWDAGYRAGQAEGR